MLEEAGKKSQECNLTQSMPHEICIHNFVLIELLLEYGVLYGFKWCIKHNFWVCSIGTTTIL